MRRRKVACRSGIVVVYSPISISFLHAHHVATSALALIRIKKKKTKIANEIISPVVNANKTEWLPKKKDKFKLEEVPI